MQTIEEIQKEIDRLFAENQANRVECYLLEILQQARQEQDQVTILHVWNELMGYYRQLSQKEKLLEAIEGGRETALGLQLQGTVPYATTLLNMATGYRSIGWLEEAGRCYEEAEQIYRKELSPGDMQFASLYNNRSLLCQEMQDYEQAQQYLKRALEIAKENRADFQVAATYANLANTAVMNGQYLQAQTYARTSINLFRQQGTMTAHYGAAVSALGMSLYHLKEYSQAKEMFEKAMDIVESMAGKNEQYERLKENRNMCMEKIGTEDKGICGLDLCRSYYEHYGKKMIEQEFGAYRDKIAVGLVGQGSDCFGFDDHISRDHDWGPGFCMWVTDQTYEEIGEALEEAYEKLPKEFMGFACHTTVHGAGRRGVHRISDFYRRLIGTHCYEEIAWDKVEDYALAAATNGQVFVDSEGIFSDLRNRLKAGYPEPVLYLKIAEDVAQIAQTGQYNFARMLERGEQMIADIMLSDCLKHMMKLWHHCKNSYPPHDKWLYRSCKEGEGSERFLSLLDKVHGLQKEKNQNLDEIMEEVGQFWAHKLYDMSFISDIDTYLDAHTEELLQKAGFSKLDHKQLVNQIVAMEFRAFDQVENEGGRASCQNDWPTFSVMRKSQYLTWDKSMLIQYAYDFQRELSRGHNLITEKYGRMMESTAPEKYEQLSKHFPELSDQKKAVIEQIVAIQMDMAREFSERYPELMANARTLYTYQDNRADTSYETYLRGEISTYSDKMLQLYGKYVVTCATQGRNIAAETIENTARLYGYGTLEEFAKG